MHDRKTHCQHLICLEQMTDIGFAVSLAYRTVTLRVYWQIIAHVFFIFDVYNTVPCEQMPVSAVSCRHYAVKKVNSARNPLDYIAGRSDAHKIAGLVLGHELFHGLYGIIHLLMRFTDGKTADGITGEIELGNLFHMLYAYICKHSALIYSKQHLTGIDRILAAPSA